jgi:ubiquinone/menaquinone biosynthesis C-methylase UbiE
MRQVMINTREHVAEQYRDGSNLNARARLHERFSTGIRNWFDWYFDQIDLPAGARILEMGCGTGMLWSKNRTRIPLNWQLTLVDFSLGMLETTRATGLSAGLVQGDAQAVPFASSRFDAVLANHMLYHVPDVPLALSEFHRVLKRDGALYAATNGAAHMRELDELLVDLCEREPVNPTLSFSLENASEQLSKYFTDIRRLDFESNLAVTEVEPLLDYVFSISEVKPLRGTRMEQELARVIAERIRSQGAFRITKAVGLFEARNR